MLSLSTDLRPQNCYCGLPFRRSSARYAWSLASDSLNFAVDAKRQTGGNMNPSSESARISFQLDDLEVESFSLLPVAAQDLGGTLEAFAQSSNQGSTCEVSNYLCMSPSDCHDTCGGNHTCYGYPTCWIGNTDCNCTGDTDQCPSMWTMTC